MVAPSARTVDMPIENGFVGMVDRAVFDEWLRRRAATAGAERRVGCFVGLARDADGTPVVQFRSADAEARVRARVVVGADGARSAVAASCIPRADQMPCVFAYHEIVQAPATGFDGTRCDVYYQGRLSPDFYGWVFPHGSTVSVGCGTARKGFRLRQAVVALREAAGLSAVGTVRCEGAPNPLRPLRRWDNGRDVIVAGDAAGVVAPASGEGIYYAMEGGRLAAEAAAGLLESGNPASLRNARRRFMRAHGRVFWILRVMQRFWYSSDRLREHFVSLCGDRDVQRLTWDAYMNKQLTRADPLSHARIFLKDLAHWLGLASA
jgi:geranylgeranyl reductase